MQPAASRWHSNSIQIVIIKHHAKWVLWWKNILGDFSGMKEKSGLWRQMNGSQSRGRCTLAVWLCLKVERLRTCFFIDKIKINLLHRALSSYKWDSTVHGKCSSAIMQDKFLWLARNTINANFLPLFRFFLSPSPPPPSLQHGSQCFL